MNSETKNVLLSAYTAIGLPISGILLFFAYILTDKAVPSVQDYVIATICVFVSLSSIYLYKKLSARESDPPLTIRTAINGVLYIVAVIVITSIIW
ncbi:hypothetical protein ACG1BZ_06720 [Microbulbifer sp. CNSA002]|uniref:hypothetical protein n=1 Tax=unclassified Microbulbifer TaxID=2619833 RepID=UPI0039B411CF